MKLKDWAIALGLTIGAMVVNVAASFAWVWVYSQIEPGQTQAAYQAYAERTAPLSSIILGSPILFAAGWLAGRGREAGHAAMMGLAVGGLYVAIDVALVLAIVLTVGGQGPWLWAAVSWLTKPLFGWLGGRVGARKPA